ncbi:MAG: YcbK family protein [Nitrospiraceae bacterium]|nr:YcbK family protein [Nitrospiraceae bacterium]
MTFIAGAVHRGLPAADQPLDGEEEGQGNADEDLYDDHPLEPVQLASATAAGLARLAPNGILKQRDNVEVNCFKPELVRVLKSIERHYGRKLVVTSGYRSPKSNRRAGGSSRSMHMYCAAADVQVPGVGKWQLAKFLRTMPQRGGVGGLWRRADPSFGCHAFHREIRALRIPRRRVLSMLRHGRSDLVDHGRTSRLPTHHTTACRRRGDGVAAFPGAIPALKSSTLTR